MWGLNATMYTQTYTLTLQIDFHAHDRSKEKKVRKKNTTADKIWRKKTNFIKYAFFEIAIYRWWNKNNKKPSAQTLLKY